MHSYCRGIKMETTPPGDTMRYFVHVKLNEAILSEEPKGFSEFYDACGRAAAIASNGIIKCSNDAGDGTAAKRLAVEVVDSDGKLLIRIPMNPAYQ